MMDQSEQSLAVPEVETLEDVEASVEVLEEGTSLSQIKAAARLIDRHHRPDQAKVKAMKAFLYSFERHADISKACASAGISRQRLWNWRREYPWLDERIEALSKAHVEDVEATAYQMATDGQSQVMTRWYLERAAPNKWGKAQEKGNGPPLTIQIQQNVYDAI